MPACAAKKPTTAAPHSYSPTSASPNTHTNTRNTYENRNLLLMDEPFSAVDAVTRYQLQNLAARLLRGKTVLMITHDPAEALRLADHLYILDHGLRELPANSDPAQLLEALGA